MSTTNNTTSNHFTPPIHCSDVGPSNTRQVTDGNPHIQDSKRGSPLSSLLRRNFTREELRGKINEYGGRLKTYEGKRAKSVTNEKQKANLDNILKGHQKRVFSCQQKVLDQMLMITEQCKVKGFVYGMVTETSKTITRVSDSLRAWWMKEVMFDNAGATQTDIYCKQNSLSSNAVQDNADKSTSELLMILSDRTLGSILSLIMQQCDPPQRRFPFERGERPSWWPTTQEGWWSQSGISTNEGFPPYRKPHDLGKKWKVVVIIGIIKLMSPDFSRPHNIVEQSRYLKSRMSAKEKKFWNLALISEAKKYCQQHQDKPVEDAIAFLRGFGVFLNIPIN